VGGGVPATADPAVLGNREAFGLFLFRLVEDTHSHFDNTKEPLGLSQARGRQPAVLCLRSVISAEPGP
jgi:hypothetical protein